MLSADEVETPLAEVPYSLWQAGVSLWIKAGVGSGSTGVAALRKGRHFIGGELSDHYAAVAEQRLRAEMTQDDFVLAGPEE
ncbi:hypothetical protein SAMN05216267_103477 [Actinacidiphila rubida]|uniref:DNA methylase N-4/N-6 domain-containing protein n=1 Tax=Actinacidiphila rubida TaxID=310780 RepID=A0A1H8RGE3_9ACTN|nr:hypothetical protein SAMN05216267_103477 [Actinacidiphila rubida]